jgi:hypothetical protein
MATDKEVMSTKLKVLSAADAIVCTPVKLAVTICKTQPVVELVNTVPVSAGKDKVLVPASAGTARVTAPDVAPLITTLPISLLPLLYYLRLPTQELLDNLYSLLL